MGQAPLAPPSHSFFGKDRQGQPLGVANHRQSAPGTHLGIGQQTMQVIHARDRLLVERHDYVTFAQARGPRRASVLNANDDHAGFSR